MSVFLDGGPALLCGVVPLLSCSGAFTSSHRPTSTSTTISAPISAPSPPPPSSSASHQAMQQEIHQRLQSSLSTTLANPQQGEEDEQMQRLRRRHMARVEAGRSKSGMWGPTHSIDSEDTTSMSSDSTSIMKSLASVALNAKTDAKSPDTIPTYESQPPQQQPQPQQPQRGTSSPATVGARRNGSPATVPVRRNGSPATVPVRRPGSPATLPFRRNGSPATLPVPVATDTSSPPTKATTEGTSNTESPTKTAADPNPQGSSSGSTSSSSSPTSTRRSTSPSIIARELLPPTATVTSNAGHSSTQHSEKSIWERATCTMLYNPRYFWRSKQPSQRLVIEEQDETAATRTPFPSPSALQRHADMLADFMEETCGGHQRTRSMELTAQLTRDDTLLTEAVTKETTKDEDDNDDHHYKQNDDNDDDGDNDVLQVHEEVEVDMNSPLGLPMEVEREPPVVLPPILLPIKEDEPSLRLVAEVIRTISDPAPMVSRSTSAAVSSGINGPTTTGTLDPPTTVARMSSTATTATPISRRRLRHQERQQRDLPLSPKPGVSSPSPTTTILPPAISPVRQNSASPTTTAALKASPMPPLAPQPSTAQQKQQQQQHPEHEGAMAPAAANTATRTTSVIPLEMLTVKVEDARELERSISELTMRSSYAEATSKISEQRRMAYYAVGRHHRNSGRGGNRRCYFSGKLILGGAPFYAGSVQQGLRTLVVFCLPSAIGLPKGVELRRQESLSSYASRTSALPSSTSLTTSQSSYAQPPPPHPLSIQSQQQHPLNRELAIGVVAQPRNQSSTTNNTSAAVVMNRISSSSISDRLQAGETQGRMGLLEREQRSSLRTSRSKRTYSAGGSVGSKGHSRISSLDDMSLSIEEDLDPNWGLDRDYLLQVLPEPNQELLDEMAKRYPEQFETLPVQVRSPHCWRLFVKFCFFSGLPIAEGEMHYKVRDEIAQEAYGEEIILSHEVMEAVNGESAEILRLPNQKTFRYLRKHYTQQSGKLPDVVFRRQSWILERPEV